MVQWQKCLAKPSRARKENEKQNDEVCDEVEAVVESGFLEHAV
jgi:hypothetical protein